MFEGESVRVVSLLVLICWLGCVVGLGWARTSVCKVIGVVYLSTYAISMIVLVLGQGVHC